MSKNNDILAGVLGEKVTIRGDLISDHTLRFDGTLDGTLVARDVLFMGKNGLINGRLIGHSLTVSGTVKGEIYSLGKLELQEGARIEGSIHAVVVQIAAGAFISAECHFGRAAEATIREITALLEEQRQ